MDNQNSKDKQPSVGKLGEDLAANFLEEKGFNIIERNYRFGHGEIDIIAEKEEMLIFIEVKTKKFGDFGDPINWVSRGKQKQIGRIARGYLYEKNITDRDCRFDVVLVTWEDGLWKIDHLENAFWL
ncbi:MAG TPA: YraN family protein [bacterium]